MMYIFYYFHSFCSGSYLKKKNGKLLLVLLALDITVCLYISRNKNIYFYKNILYICAYIHGSLKDISKYVHQFQFQVYCIHSHAYTIFHPPHPSLKLAKVNIAMVKKKNVRKQLNCDISFFIHILPVQTVYVAFR